MYKPPGGLYSKGRFNGGFFALRFRGAYKWRGLFSEFYGMLFSAGAFGKSLIVHFSRRWERGVEKSVK